MLGLDELRRERDLLNEIDWDMTPEEAVRLYLEWGNNWTRGNYVIRSKDDVTHYFVVNTWGDTPVIFLIRRSSEEAEELARIELTGKIRDQVLESVGHHKGVYAVDGELRQWLKRQLGNA